MATYFVRSDRGQIKKSSGDLQTGGLSLKTTKTESLKDLSNVIMTQELTICKNKKQKLS